MGDFDQKRYPDQIRAKRRDALTDLPQREQAHIVIENRKSA